MMNRYCQMRMVLFFVIATGGTGGVSMALANDTMIEIGAGGLEYVRSDAIEMVREDLYISMDSVEVNYVFRNHTDQDVVAMVAFPMPDIIGDPYGDVSIPRYEDNFLGFSVQADGQDISPALQQRASVLGVDISRDLNKAHVPLFNYGADISDILGRQPAALLERLEGMGAVQIDSYDGGNGVETYIYPLWTLHSVYYWEMRFPAGEELRVSHEYAPAVGATTGLTQSIYDGDGTLVSAEYSDKYCVDAGFARAAQNKLDDGYKLFEHWISYILTTGQNWHHNIGTFHLTIDKGLPGNLVSFCGEGVTKTSPTTFELTYQDYRPDSDLEVLVLQAERY